MNFHLPKGEFFSQPADTLSKWHLLPSGRGGGGLLVICKSLGFHANGAWVRNFIPIPAALTGRKRGAERVAT